MLSKLSRLKQLLGMLAPIADNQQKTALYAAWSGNKLIFDKLLFHINSIMLPLDVQLKRYGRNNDGGYVMADDF